jgi:hypothetical protein
MGVACGFLVLGLSYIFCMIFLFLLNWYTYEHLWVLAFAIFFSKCFVCYGVVIGSFFEYTYGVNVFVSIFDFKLIKFQFKYSLVLLSDCLVAVTAVLYN